MENINTIKEHAYNIMSRYCDFYDDKKRQSTDEKERGTSIFNQISEDPEKTEDVIGLTLSVIIDNVCASTNTVISEQEKAAIMNDITTELYVRYNFKVYSSIQQKPTGFFNYIKVIYEAVNKNSEDKQTLVDLYMKYYFKYYISDDAKVENNEITNKEELFNEYAVVYDQIRNKVNISSEPSRELFNFYLVCAEMKMIDPINNDKIWNEKLANYQNKPGYDIDEIIKAIANTYVRKCVYLELKKQNNILLRPTPEFMNKYFLQYNISCEKFREVIKTY